MSFLFKKKKSAVDLIKSTKKHLEILSDPKTRPEEMAHSLEKMTFNLNSIKLQLYGDNENEPNEESNAKLCDYLFQSESSSTNNHESHNLLLLLLLNIKKFEFEARKDVAQIFSYLLRHHKSNAVEYVRSHSDMLRLLIDGYNDTEVALNCGAILREIIRHEELASAILNNRYLMSCLFELVQLNTFDIASDAFATFKLLLTKHKKIDAEWLNANFDDFCRQYSILLQNGNYVTKRQSLKLLGELLLNRANFSVMMLYINSAENLKIMMNLLRGNTKAIQFEAFHVFKIFVANPRKSQAVAEILVRNKFRLIDFLHKFTKDRDDELFEEEKKTLITTLEQLQAPAGSDVVPAQLEEHSTSTSGHNTLNLSMGSLPAMTQNMSISNTNSPAAHSSTNMSMGDSRSPAASAMKSSSSSAVADANRTNHTSEHKQ